MDLFDALGAVVRRWYVALPVLVITVVAAVAVNNQKTSEYSSTAIVGVTTGSTSIQPPTRSGAPSVARSNALVANGGVTLIASLLSIRLSSPEISGDVADAGGTRNYAARVEQTNAGVSTQLPIVNISAKDRSAPKVRTTVTILLARATQVLRELQVRAGIPSDKYANSYLIQPASQPSRTIVSTARNVGIVIAVGIVFGLLLSAGVDNLVARRRRPEGRYT